MTCISTIRYFLSWTIFSLCTLPLTFGSSGDRSEQFQRCLAQCFGTCNGNLYPARLPVYLVGFGWSCADECKYVCMHKVTQHAVAGGWEIEQFYGKVSAMKK